MNLRVFSIFKVFFQFLRQKQEEGYNAIKKTCLLAALFLGVGGRNSKKFNLNLI